MYQQGSWYYLSSAERGTWMPPNAFTATLVAPSDWITAAAEVSFRGLASEAPLEGASLGSPGETWSAWVAASNNVTSTMALQVGSDSPGKPLVLRLRDQNGQVASVVTGTIRTDSTSPSSTLWASPRKLPSPAIILTWSGSDKTSGLANYDVEVRHGPTGSWTPVLSGVTQTTVSIFQNGVSRYYFRVRARDRAGNVEAWPADYDALVEDSTAPSTAMTGLPSVSPGTFSLS